MEMYPLVTDFATASAAPPTVARAEVYNSSLAIWKLLFHCYHKAVDGTTYGRMNYYAGKTLLAKMYLNAGVYTGTAQWDKVIAACDEIINSGKYSPRKQLFRKFQCKQFRFKEFIFAIPYDQIFFTGFNLAHADTALWQASLHIILQHSHGMVSAHSKNSTIHTMILTSEKEMLEHLTAPAVKRGNFLAGYQYTAVAVNMVHR